MIVTSLFSRVRPGGVVEPSQGPDQQAAINSGNRERPLPIPEPTLPNAAPSPVRWYPGMDAPGNDLGGRAGWVKDVATKDECLRMCLSNSRCTGFTYNIRYSVCIPKSRIAPMINSGDPAITGVLTDRAETPAAMGTV